MFEFDDLIHIIDTIASLGEPQHIEFRKITLHITMESTAFRSLYYKHVFTTGYE